MAEAAPDISPADKRVVGFVNELRREAHEAKSERLRRNEDNFNAYMNRQDWSHKVDGQSAEFIPKTSQVIEQFAAFMRRGLTQFGDWNEIQMGKQSPLSGESARMLLMAYLDRLPDVENATGYNTTTDFSTRLADGIKTALMESLMVFKVHGMTMNQRVYQYEQGKGLVTKTLKPWRLQIDVVPTKDYYPDPTGRGMYEIHRVERDFHQVQAMVDAGLYDADVLAQLKEDFEAEDEQAEKERRPRKNKYRRVIVIDEFWGNIVDEEGKVTDENVLTAIANEKYLIRPPEENPWWHQESPFVAQPIIRVPQTVWHKALADEFVPINIAMNEMFSLMLDGGIASVWGVRQVRTEHLEDPNQITDGIPQGATLAVKDSLPQGEKVIEQITEGSVPGDALAMYNTLERVFNGAAKTNEINMGMLPPRQVLATEVSEASQNGAVVMDSIVADVELGLNKVIRKAFMVLLQNADDLLTSDIQDALTPREQLALARMDPGERFAKLVSGASFRVTGLSAMIAKARDFQKFMALLQVSMQNPILLNSFMRRFSGDKILSQILRQLNINPRNIERSDDEDGETEVMNVLGLMPLLTGARGQGGGGVSAQVSGEPGLPSEINQEQAPSQIM